MMIIAMKKNKAVWGLAAVGRREEGAVSNSVVREGLTEKGTLEYRPESGREAGCGSLGNSMLQRETASAKTLRWIWAPCVFKEKDALMVSVEK